jgi:LacI family transcriptional regulator
LVRVADFRESGGHLAMQQLLEESHRPDAVFVSNNRMAIGALQAIDESGLTIPGDVGVVGYDDIAWVGLMRTPLTTVSSPAYDLGLESGRLLLSRIEGFTGAPRTVVLSPSLIVGASSAPKAITRRGPRRSGAVRT